MTDEALKVLKRIAECLSFISLWLFLILMSGCMGCFSITTKGAQITLAVDPPQSPVNEHRVYVGLSPNSYFAFYDFPATNRFAVTVTNTGKIYLAASAFSYEFGESDLSSEIQVLLFVGDVQLGESVNGPWTNYFEISIPVQTDQPMQAVRTKLRVQ